VDHHTYVMCGDGDLMEGVTAEAASLAGHLGLAKLICLYDDNGISIEGSTGIAFTENVAKRFDAYGWQVIKVKDGSDAMPSKKPSWRPRPKPKSPRSSCSRPTSPTAAPTSRTPPMPTARRWEKKRSS
jgi:hypothetical protein